MDATDCFVHFFFQIWNHRAHIIQETRARFPSTVGVFCCVWIRATRILFRLVATCELSLR
jgi:hypothetical protein